MKVKLVTSILCLILIASSFVLFNDSKAYANDDVTGIALEKEMRAMISLGVMQGYGEGVYQPKQEINRGQFAALMSRALELPEGPPAFWDVSPGTTLANDIYKASKAGIINGYSDGTFRMNDPITRQQMALMIDNALKYLNVPRKEAPLIFKDAADIGKSSRSAVARAVYEEIVLGFSYPDGTYNFLPNKTATRAEAAAFIHRMLRTWKPEYKVATIDSNKNLIPGSTIYSSYAEANSVAGQDSNQVVTRNDEIISMPAGIVISSPPFGSALTNIYKDENFSTGFTYLPAQQEMEYIRSTDQFVEVKIAGATGYVKQREISLIPQQLMKGKNYYSVNPSGELEHYIYIPSRNSYEKYVAGKASSFMTAGNNYYSWDGGVFYNSAGELVGTAYQYFNYLPARTVTNYSAEELNSIIDKELAKIEQLYQNNPTVYKTYKDATKISKIKGLGTYAKEAESKYKINALLILGLAIHESNYGMNYFSQDRNNLFSINAIDDDENQADYFESPSAAIDALATRLLNKNYINPLGGYAYGGVLGNKSRGLNVKYASDPYWGQKVAGHMYRIDKSLGGKDYGKYRIGETTNPGVNVRHTPEVNSDNQQFTYRKDRMPVAILETTTRADGNWYKIISDHNIYNEGYIQSSYVQEMEILQ